MIEGVEWIDNHCHLDDDSVVETLAAAETAGVSTLVTVGCDLASSLESIAFAERYDNVWATAGVHPHEAKHGCDGLEALLDHPKVMAVGEAGFDFHYNHSGADEQKSAFATQVGLANKHDLPLVIHTREAWEETFALLDAEGVPRRTVFHCFTGGADEAAECVARGAMISISGIVTFKSAVDVREAVETTPLNRLLVETDSPFLAPVPHRGKPNQPAFVSLVGEKVAEIKGLDVAAVAASTSQSARDFYRFGSSQN